jgi:hypothetical protein
MARVSVKGTDRISREVAMYMLARAVRIATGITVAFIIAGILIHVLEANTSNGIVSVINDVAKWLVQPFDDMFEPNSDKTRIALNWGLGAVVYAVVGGLLARMLARSALAGQIRRPWRRRPAA